MIAYCQTGRNDIGASVLALAGVLARAEDWSAFEPRWRRLMAECAVPDCGLLLPDLVAGQGEFAEGLGWTPNRRLELLRRALGFAALLKAPEFRAFACAVDLDCYRSLEQFDDLLLSPEHLCHYFVPRAILSWCSSKLPRTELRVVNFAFDPNEPFLALFGDSLKSNRVARPAHRGPHDSASWALAGEASAIDVRQSAPAQLAALIAWTVHARFGNAGATKGDAFTAALREEGGLEPFVFTPVDSGRLCQMAWARFPTEFLLEEWR